MMPMRSFASLLTYAHADYLDLSAMVLAFQEIDA